MCIFNMESLNEKSKRQKSKPNNDIIFNAHKYTALMSIDSTNKEWIILLSSFVFSMDMIVIPLLFIFFIIYIGDCLEKL